jgi:hypothetical protein
VHAARQQAAPQRAQRGAAALVRSAQRAQQPAGRQWRVGARAHAAAEHEVRRVLLDALVQAPAVLHDLRAQE